jgi:hypothetical protein
MRTESGAALALGLTKPFHEAAEIFALSLGAIGVLGAAADFIENLARTGGIDIGGHSRVTIADARTVGETPQRIAGPGRALIALCAALRGHLRRQLVCAFAQMFQRRILLRRSRGKIAAPECVLSLAHGLTCRIERGRGPGAGSARHALRITQGLMDVGLALREIGAARTALLLAARTSHRGLPLLRVLLLLLLLLTVLRLLLMLPVLRLLLLGVLLLLLLLRIALLAVLLLLGVVAKRTLATDRVGEIVHALLHALVGAALA